MHTTSSRFCQTNSSIRKRYILKEDICVNTMSKHTTHELVLIEHTVSFSFQTQLQNAWLSNVRSRHRIVDHDNYETISTTYFVLKNGNIQYEVEYVTCVTTKMTTIRSIVLMILKS